MSEAAIPESAPPAEPVAEVNPAEAVADGEPQENAEKSPPEEIPEYRKVKHKVKLPDGEFEVDYDELVRSYQKGKTLTQREQENAKLRKEALSEKDRLAQFLNAAKGDPNLIWQLAQELGHDPAKLAVERAYEIMEFEKKTPDEKRAIEAERKASQYEAKIKQIEDERIENEKSYHAKQVEEEIQNDILTVVKELGGDVDATDIETIAQIQQALYYANGTKPDPKEVAKRVLAREQQVTEKRLKRALKSSEDLAAILDKDLLKLIQKQLVDKARKDLPSIPPSKPAASGSTPAKSKKMGVDTWFKSLGRS